MVAALGNTIGKTSASQMSNSSVSPQTYNKPMKKGHEGTQVKACKGLEAAKETGKKYDEAPSSHVNVIRLRFHDTHAFFAAIYLFRGYLLLPRCFIVPVSPNQTIQETPTGKIGVYNRFFEFANFRLPLSTFLVNVLRHYRINLSQLSLIAAAKVSHFEILCRIHGIEPTVGLFRCFYVNSKNKGWISFSKRPDSDAVCYTKPLDSLKAGMAISSGSILLLVLLPFRGIPTKMSLETLFQSQRSLVRMIMRSLLLIRLRCGKMDLFAFIQVADPTKVKVGELERAEEETRLLDSTVGRVVPLLPVPLARAECELEASVERLFDEGGSTNQGDSAVGGGQDVGTGLVMGVKIIVAKNVTAEKPKRPRKKRHAVTDASGSSHPPKKLKGDYGTFGEVATSGMSPSVIKELLASNMLNVEVGVVALVTLPMVTSSISAMPKHESGAPVDFIIGPNLRTIGASERFIIFSDSSHHSGTNASGTEDDSIIRSVVIPLVMTEAVVTSHAVSVMSVSKTGTKVTSPVHASMFHDSDFMESVKADVAEFNVGTASQAYLNVKVRMRTKYRLSKRKRLESECEIQADLLKARYGEIENLKAQLLLKDTEATKAAHLRAQVSAAEATRKIHTNEIDALKQRNAALENEKESLDGKVTELQSLIYTKDLELKDLNVAVHALETTCSGLRDQVSGYVPLKEQIEEFQDVQMNIVNDKVAKLDADLLEMALHLKETFYLNFLTTRSGRRWLLTHGLKLAIVKCLNS
nr:hypothetical protein [Tanacetum cinerariifolium]